MPNLPRSPRSGGRRLVVAVISVVAVSVALAAMYVARGRSHPRTPGTAAAFAVPSGTAGPSSAAPDTSAAPATSAAIAASEASAAPASGAARTGGPTTCGPGQDGPLRLDTRFTADDGKGTEVPYSISLPDDYYSACKQYPVVYALHGKTQDNVTFMDEALSMRKAMAAGALEQSIIVTPDSYSTGRWENRETGPAEDNVIKYLIPYVEQNYRVRPGPSYRLLTGFSMGGHGAMRFGLKYPRMFAAVWSVDGAMAGTEDYLPFVEGTSSGDFRIIAVGGKLNGDRVQRLVKDLGRHGVEIPYVYQDLEHEFVDFVEEDGRTGWYAMKYLQYHLGRSR